MPGGGRARRLSRALAVERLELLPPSPTLGGRWALVVIEAPELRSVRERFGADASTQLALEMFDALGQHGYGARLVGIDDADRVIAAIPARTRNATYHLLNRTAGEISHVLYQLTEADGTVQELVLTPQLGYAVLERGRVAHSLAQAVAAAAETHVRGDTEPTLGEVPLSRDQMVSAIGAEATHAERFSPRTRVEPRPVDGASRAAERMRRVVPSRARRIIARIRTEGRIWYQFALSLLIGLGVPYFGYVIVGNWGFDLTTVTYPLVVVALLTTILLIIVECFLGANPTRPPGPEPTEFPPASAIIAAYLPNEADTIVDTVRAFQNLDYPATLQVVIAYNTPTDLPVEEELANIARQDPRIVPLRVSGSTSKAQNVNAALEIVTGEFVGIFDADHQPHPGAFRRAWHWLGETHDVVQGHCVVRNGETSGVAATVAVEFEAIYAVSHPGRARMHGFGIFGGSNGYWRTPVLRAVRMRKRMLTEDIDSSIRGTLAGYRFASDPLLLSFELAPVTLGQLVNQRLRWAQGWTQVSMRWLVPALLSPGLSVRQKLGMIHLLGWREAYAWLSLQVAPILVYTFANRHAPISTLFVAPLVAATLLSWLAAPTQAALAYLLAEPGVRRHTNWFWRYLLIGPFYTELKSALTRIAHLKEASKERTWRVTPRTPASQDPAPSPTVRAGLAFEEE